MLLKSKFEYELEQKFKKLYNPKYHTEIIFLCVGTDKIIGDAIGPIVGSKLEENAILNKQKNINIFGKLGNTLNFKNATDVSYIIKQNYTNPFIITIDAALSSNENTGEIVIGEGIIEIGNSLGRSIKWKSNINIKGVVGKYTDNPYTNIETLKNAEIYPIMQISKNIIRGIEKALLVNKIT